MAVRSGISPDHLGQNVAVVLFRDFRVVISNGIRCFNLMNARPDFSSKLHMAQWLTIQAIVFLVITGSSRTLAQDKPDPGAAELKKVMTELREAIKDGNDTKIAELTGKVLPDAERIGKGLGMLQRDRHFVFHSHLGW